MNENSRVIMMTAAGLILGACLLGGAAAMLSTMQRADTTELEISDADEECAGIFV